MQNAMTQPPSVLELRRISVRATGLRPEHLAWLAGAGCVCFPGRHAPCGPFTLVVFPSGTLRQEIPRADAQHSSAKSFLLRLPTGDILEEVARPEQHSFLFFDRVTLRPTAPPPPAPPEPPALPPHKHRRVR